MSSRLVAVTAPGFDPSALSTATEVTVARPTIVIAATRPPAHWVSLITAATCSPAVPIRRSSCRAFPRGLCRVPYEQAEHGSADIHEPDVAANLGISRSCSNERDRPAVGRPSGLALASRRRGQPPRARAVGVHDVYVTPVIERDLHSVGRPVRVPSCVGGQLSSARSVRSNDKQPW